MKPAWNIFKSTFPTKLRCKTLTPDLQQLFDSEQLASQALIIVYMH